MNLYDANTPDTFESLFVVNADLVLWSGDRIIAELPIASLKKPWVRWVNESEDTVVVTKQAVIIYGMPLADVPIVAWSCHYSTSVIAGADITWDWGSQPLFFINSTAKV